MITHAEHVMWAANSCSGPCSAMWNGHIALLSRAMVCCAMMRFDALSYVMLSAGDAAAAARASVAEGAEDCQAAAEAGASCTAGPAGSHKAIPPSDGQHGCSMCMRIAKQCIWDRCTTSADAILPPIGMSYCTVTGDALGVSCAGGTSATAAARARAAAGAVCGHTTCSTTQQQQQQQRSHYCQQTTLPCSRWQHKRTRDIKQEHSPSRQCRTG